MKFFDHSCLHITSFLYIYFFKFMFLYKIIIYIKYLERWVVIQNVLWLLYKLNIETQLCPHICCILLFFHMFRLVNQSICDLLLYLLNPNLVYIISNKLLEEPNLNLFKFSLEKHSVKADVINRNNLTFHPSRLHLSRA